MKSIETCCICNSKADIIYQLPLPEVYGMAKDYIQIIKMCPKCGFIFTANPFEEKILASRYKKLSGNEYDREKKEYKLSDKSDYKSRSLRQNVFIKNVIGNINSLFEVGCASGYNLNLYKNDGTEVYGIEPSKTNVISCKENYGIELFNGMFSDFVKYIGEGGYDLIFLSHVLEHVVNPFKFITELSKINNQYIFIEVPCLDYNFCNIPFSIIGDEHVNLFSLESLSYLMKKAGYSVLDVDLYFNLCSDLIGGNPMISTLWEKSSKPNSVSKEKFIPISTQKLITDYLFEAKRKIRLLNSIIDDIDDNSKLAIWGTGFTTSLLLGNTNLAKKNIVKFYDNDLRRNNTEYYHRKINPFHVSDVNNNNVEIILVATYGYQNEIIQILENHDIYNYIKVF